MGLTACCADRRPMPANMGWRRAWWPETKNTDLFPVDARRAVERLKGLRSPPAQHAQHAGAMCMYPMSQAVPGAPAAARESCALARGEGQDVRACAQGT